MRLGRFVDQEIALQLRQTRLLTAEIEPIEAIGGGIAAESRGSRLLAQDRRAAGRGWRTAASGAATAGAQQQTERKHADLRQFERIAAQGTARQHSGLGE